MTLFFVFIFIIEILLFILIKLSKKVFQWLIDYSDEQPNIDETKIEKFYQNSYDPDLGWIRKGDTSGFEKSYSKESFFSIDSDGSRTNFNNKFKENYDILTYGDSFTFCRQVNNNETWQYFLSNLLKKNISNFGVGNYGIDQAFILNCRHKEKNKIIIYGIVPETILRIHSFWKHYLEYGNLLGFKPKFNLYNDNIILKKNPVVENKNYENYYLYLDQIKKYDVFYKEKFKKNIIKFPFTLYFFRNLKRNFCIILFSLFIMVTKKFEISNKILKFIINNFVIKDNINLSAKFYNNDKSLLLEKIILNINKFNRENNSKFLLVVIPQLADLNFKNKSKMSYYNNFYKNLSQKVDIIDLTDDFSKHKMYQKLYVKDKYGGHLNMRGNQLVSEKISSYIKNNFVSLLN